MTERSRLHRPHDETIGGVPVLVGERNVAWIEDGIVFVATAESPDAIVGYRPFLDAFIQAQADMAPVG